MISATRDRSGVEMHRRVDEVDVLLDVCWKTVFIARDVYLAGLLVGPRVVLGAKDGFSLSNTGVE